MTDTSWLYSEETIERLSSELDDLKTESGASASFLIDKNGQLLASSKTDSEYDTTSIAALVAGNVAATDNLAKLLGEDEFSILFHEGNNENIHISLVFRLVILAVIFDDSTSLGLIRLRVKNFVSKLEKVLNESSKKEVNKKDNIFDDITDDDIDGLFGQTE